VGEYLAEIYPDPKDMENENAVEKIRESRRRAGQLFVVGKGNDRPGVRATLWAAYNGVTELADHGKQFQTPEKRLEAACFGDGYSIKGRALRVARAKLRIWTK
jgi:hypothetical protein